MAIAQQCMTAQAAASGRFVLGLGLSHKIVIENMMGLSYDRPVRHFRDYMGVLGPLSKLQPVQYEGEAYSSMGAFNAPGAEPFGVVGVNRDGETDGCSSASGFSRPTTSAQGAASIASMPSIQPERPASSPSSRTSF